MIGKKPSSGSPAAKKPILIGLITLVGLAFAIIAQSVLGNAPSQVAGAQLQTAALKTAAITNVATPRALQDAIEAIGRAEQGRNGILIRSVEDDWVAGYRGATTFSQGTLRRVWLGAALLNAVDRGELMLEQFVTLLAVNRTDRQAREQVGELLRRAVMNDDPISQDNILGGLNGPLGMTRWLEDNQIEEVVYGPTNFELARIYVRKDTEGTNRSLDGATPDGMAFGLSRIFAGKVLSASSTRILLGYFSSVPKEGGGPKPGWQILRMTGETATSRGQIVSASGVALVHLPSGRRFSVVVFAEGPLNTIVRRDKLLAGALAALAQIELR